MIRQLIAFFPFVLLLNFSIANAATNSSYSASMRVPLFGDIAVDSESTSTTPYGLRIFHGTIGLGQTKSTEAAGARVIVNDRNAPDNELEWPEKSIGYNGKWGNANDAVYAFASGTTGAALSAEQDNATGYAIYAIGGRSYFENNTGIGTASPQDLLHVYQDNFDGDVAIRITNAADWTSSTASTTASLLFKQRYYGGDHSAGRIVSGREGNYHYTADRDSFLAFHTTQDDLDAERMRITSNGSIGVGTTTPSKVLSIVGKSSGDGIQLFSGSGGNDLEFGLGRAAIDGKIAIAGAGGSYLSDSTQGDMILGLSVSDKKIRFGYLTGPSAFTISSSSINIGRERLSTQCFSATTCQLSCSSGKKVLGGGCSVSSGSMTGSYPAGTFGETAWYCEAATTTNIWTYAVCASVE